jgi:hypothetical protein
LLAENGFGQFGHVGVGVGGGGNVLRDINVDYAEVVADSPVDVGRDSVVHVGIMWVYFGIVRIRLSVELRSGCISKCATRYGEDLRIMNDQENLPRFINVRRDEDLIIKRPTQLRSLNIQRSHFVFVGQLALLRYSHHIADALSPAFL